MEIYIEYALLENFLFDSVLLWLSLTAAKMPICRWRILLAAAIGAMFAVLFPLLKFPLVVLTLLKLTVGAFLCMVAFGRLKTKKEWGRYALTLAFFFSFSFGFGGTLLGVYSNFSLEQWERIPSVAVFIGFAILTFFVLLFVKKLYARRIMYSHLYVCRVFCGEKMKMAQGFCDSGNLARKNALPVCFLCPALLYEVFEEEIWKGGGQVCDEMVISTMSGKRITQLYRGEIEVETKEGIVRSEVYFAPSKNMIGREYQILFGAGILEKGEEL